MVSPRTLGFFAAACLAVACGPNHESLLDDDSNASAQGTPDDPESTGGSSSGGVAPTGSSSGNRGGGSSGGAGSSSGGGSSGGGGGGGGGGSSSGAAACATACGDNARCNPATNACSCLAGFHDDGGGNCVQAATGTPASHTEAEVCQHWTAGHQTSAQGNGWTAGASQCDPGTLSRPALDDAVSRINLFRWLEGLAPAVDDEAGHARAMACATVGSWNPPGTVPSPHQPPPSATCYTALGAQGAGSSNMAWGSGTMANAMDQWVRDNGNETTLGHRRWLLNPGLGRTALGFYAGGGGYDNAACMSSFDGSGDGPSPAWFAFPPEGFAPVQLVGWTWSVHLASGNANAGTLTVVRQSDGQTLGFNKLVLQDGYGAGSTVGFEPTGWQPTAGETYHATFTSGTQTLTWNVTASGC